VRRQSEAAPALSERARARVITTHEMPKAVSSLRFATALQRLRRTRRKGVKHLRSVNGWGKV